MKIPTIKDVMHGRCEFLRYEDGALWYQVNWCEEVTLDTVLADVLPTRHVTHREFDFPVPLSGDDVGGKFHNEEKAVTLMKWIRKHIEFLTKAKESGQ